MSKVKNVENKGISTKEVINTISKNEINKSEGVVTMTNTIMETMGLDNKKVMELGSEVETAVRTEEEVKAAKKAEEKANLLETLGTLVENVTVLGADEETITKYDALQLVFKMDMAKIKDVRDSIKFLKDLKNNLEIAAADRIAKEEAIKAEAERIAEEERLAKIEADRKAAEDKMNERQKNAPTPKAPQNMNADEKKATKINKRLEMLAKRRANAKVDVLGEVTVTAIEEQVAEIASKTATDAGQAFIEKQIAKKKARREANKLFDAQKKRITVKGATNILNVVSKGFSYDDKERENLQASNVDYAQVSESELLLAYKKFSPLVKEVRFFGNKKVHAPREIDNVQDEVMFLTIKNEDSVSKQMHTVYVAYDEVYVKTGDNEAVAILKAETVSLDSIKDIEVKAYQGLLYSPSQEKKNTITCFKVAQGKFSEITEDMITKGQERVINILNIATNGMVKILKKKGKLDFKNAVKLSARLSQIMAPSIRLGQCSTYAIILEKDLMSFVDGGGQYRNASLAKWLTNNHFAIDSTNKFLLKNSHVAGKIVQARPTNGVKGGFVGVEDDMINATLDNFIRVNMTSEDQLDLEDAFDGKGKFAPKTLVLVDNVVYVKGGEKFDFNTVISKDTNAIKEEVLASFNGTGRFPVVNGELTLAYAAIIGNSHLTPDFVTDLNAFKAPVDFSLPAHFIALDESRGFTGGTVASMQMLSTLLLKGEEGLKYIEETMLKNIEDSYNELIDGNYDIPTIESFNKFFLIGQMGSTLKNYVLNHDAPAFKTLVNHWLNSQLGLIEKFNIKPAHSGFCRLTADWGWLIARVNLLDEEEFYCVDVNEAYDKMEAEKAKAVIDAQPESDANKITKKVLAKATDITVIEKLTQDENTIKLAKEYFDFKIEARTAIAFRSPKMGFKEFYRGRSIGRREMVSRIKERVSDPKKQDVLIRFYSDLKAGTFVLPAMEKYKALLGGADFDFDGVTVICDNKFIKIMKGITPEIVSVIPAKGEKKNADYELGNFLNSFDMFYTQIFNGNLPIGVITYMNQLVQLLLFVEFDIAKSIIRTNFNDKALTRDIVTYKSPLDRTKEVLEITEEDVEEVVLRVRHAKLTTKKELKDIIADLNVVLRSYQERTIDASKTADEIEVLFNLLSNTKLLCVAKDERSNVEINWEKNEVIPSVDTRITAPKTIRDSQGRKKQIFTINDEFHKIMLKAYAKLTELCNKLVKQAQDIKLSPDHLTFLNDIFSKNKNLESSLIEIRKRYNEANGARLNSVNKLKDKDGKISKETRKIMMPIISATYNHTIEGLQDFTRQLLCDLSPVEKAAIVKYMAIHSSIVDDAGNSMVTINPNGGSSICHTLLPEEYFLLCMELDKNAPKVAKSKITSAGRYNTGDIADVIDGISVEEDNVPSFITNKDLTGSYTVDKSNDGAFLTEEIKNLINIEVPEKRKVVIRVVPREKGSYASIIKELSKFYNGETLGIKLNKYNKKMPKSFDKVEIVSNGISSVLGKFYCPSGESAIGNTLDKFTGNITSVNIYQGISIKRDANGESKNHKYYTVLIVAEEAEVISRPMTQQEMIAKLNAEQAELRAQLGLASKEVAVSSAAPSTPATNVAKKNSPLDNIRNGFKNANKNVAPAAQPKAPEKAGFNASATGDSAIIAKEFGYNDQNSDKVNNLLANFRKGAKSNK